MNPNELVVAMNELTYKLSKELRADTLLLAKEANVFVVRIHTERSFTDAELDASGLSFEEFVKQKFASPRKDP